MNIHKNARLTPLRREEMALAVMEGALSQAQAALKFAVTSKVVRRWVKRYEADGHAGMSDRSSRPRHSPNATDQAATDRIVALRRQRHLLSTQRCETGILMDVHSDPPANLKCGNSSLLGPVRMDNLLKAHT